MGIMIGRLHSSLAWITLGLVLYAHPALAQGGKLIDVFKDWSAFTEKENGKVFCYIGSLPEKMEGKYTQRGDALILVTHRPAEKSFDVVSIQAGYIYKKGSEVKVTIDGQKFELYTKGGYAWAKAQIDRQLVAAMKGGKTMVVEGTSSRGTLTTDTYSLSGFTAAYGAMGKACGKK
ncbi:MAG: invasion associated locus B family protein [Rhodospirillales bacterium]|jgi:invasion protein IalB|nr:invasion associated locus B family protein [Rhodospirillales bacterium]